MTTKCYFLENSVACTRALIYLADAIPCFVHQVVSKDGFTVTIECRDADLATVERVLAPYV